MVRAKMRCVETKLQSYYGDGKLVNAIVLSAVGGPANRTWAKLTPQGRVEMTIDNPEAVSRFEIGKTYYVDFTEAPATEAEEKA
jgi:hypothetical protein